MGRGRMAPVALAAASVVIETCACPYCEAPIADLGAAFSDHIATSRPCFECHDVWVERINEDWGGGD